MTEGVGAKEKQKSCWRPNRCQVMDEQMEVGKLEREGSRQKVEREGEKPFTCWYTGSVLIGL